MKNLFILALVAVLAVASMDAEARRMGGGSSFGKQSGNVTQRNAAPPAQNAATKPAPANTSAAAAAPKKPWGAMLGGLAAGLVWPGWPVRWAWAPSSASSCCLVCWRWP